MVFGNNSEYIWFLKTWWVACDDLGVRVNKLLFVCLFFWESPRVISLMRSQGESQNCPWTWPVLPHVLCIVPLETELHRPDCLLASGHATNIPVHCMWVWTTQNPESFLFSLPGTRMFFGWLWRLIWDLNTLFLFYN